MTSGGGFWFFEKVALKVLASDHFAGGDGRMHFPSFYDFQTAVSSRGGPCCLSDVVIWSFLASGRSGRAM